MPLDSNLVNDLKIPATNKVHKDRNFAVAPAMLAEGVAKPAAFVDKGSVVAFVAGVSGQNREDVLNSTLLAQLAADNKFNRETQVMDWYAFYTDVLGKVGWVSQGFNWQKYSSKQMSFTMDEAVLEIAEAAMTGQEELVLVAAMDAMKKLPKEDGRLKLFNYSASSDKEGNFQISVCSEDNGAVAMKTMAFYFSADQSSTDVLFFNFSSASTTLNQATDAQTLNSTVYADVRQAVITKLGDNAKNFVLDLDIG